MITALIDGEIKEVDEATLTPNHHVIDNENERTEVTEWRLNDVIVHRSVNMTLKKGIGIEAVLGRLG